MRPLQRLCVILLAACALPAGAQDLAAAATRMRAEAQALVAAFDAGARARLTLPFDAAERPDWHYTPRSRPGLSFADMDARQREAVHRLLEAALSAAGHRKVADIIELERVLREIETFGLMRDPEKYFVVIFGTPDAAAPWGWRFEGHHLSLNFTLRGGRLATTPSFFGANPARVPKGPKAGHRTLGSEEDEARKLLESLDAAQRRVAVVDARSYGDILTRAEAKVSPLDDRGLEARAMTEAQKAQLRRVIETYAAAFEPALAAQRLARAAEGFESIRFAWAGATERGRAHYYRIQGAKFLIEYDASQDSGNHIHTVWRDFDGDFGRDLLREHHSSSAHRHR